MLKQLLQIYAICSRAWWENEWKIQKKLKIVLLEMKTTVSETKIGWMELETAEDKISAFKDIAI